MGLKLTKNELENIISTKNEPQLNESEKEALSSQAEEDAKNSKAISIEKMEKTVDLVQDTFNLADGNYAVNSFSDKGSKSVISLTNPDFDITITIKDNEKFDLM